MTFSVPQPEEAGISVLVALFRHNAWANGKLLDFCEGLSDEQLDTTAVGTYGTIRDTLVHIVYGEVSYVERVNGNLPPNRPPDEKFPGFAWLREVADWASEEMLQLALSARSDTMVTDSWPGGTERYKLTDLMVQALNHATEHRTQVSTIVTQLGLEPPNMDGWTWMDDKGEIWVERIAAE